MKINKVQVVCPAEVVTGGPESLHNLVATLSSIGECAEIVYYPFTGNGVVPDAYVDYNVKVGVISDEVGVLLILPEILCFEAKRFSGATVAIWWLSVDNFREKKYHSWRDSFRYIKKCMMGSRPWLGARSLKNYLNFSKSFYDEAYLKANDIVSQKLTGPIAMPYVNQISQVNLLTRKNQILYNEKKGKNIVARLIAACPEFRFVPLSGLSRQELIYKYQESKLYIDFGHHPGRERMPREAAACGCCVVTGRRGSAGNLFDIPIPARYKLSDYDINFNDDFRKTVNYIFSFFPMAAKDFDEYRAEIKDEQSQQNRDLRLILRVLRESP
jgi:hypothetical protein